MLAREQLEEDCAQRIDVGASVGGVLTMTFGGWLSSKFGTHVMTPLTTIGCAVMMVFIGASRDFAGLTIALLIFGISQSAVDTTIAAGRVLMEGKVLKLDLDEEKVSRKSAELAKKLWSRF